MFHIFTFKNGLLPLFSLVTLNMVSPQKKNINKSEDLQLRLYLNIEGQTFATIHDTLISITFNTFPVLWDISA